MRLRRLIGMLLLSAALLTTSPNTISQAADPNPVPAIGSQFHALWQNFWEPGQRVEVLQKLDNAGIKWVRIDFAWDALQPQRDEYADWYVEEADRVINKANALGVKVLLAVGRTPRWANGGQPANVPPTNYADFGRVAYWLARHFEGRVNAYGVYNEPNHSQGDYWTGTAADYADLLKASYSQFNAGDPDAKIVAANVVYNDDAWIREMYAAGAEGYFDVIGVHPYPGIANEPPETPDDGTKWRFTHVPAVHDVMCDYDDCAKKIWFTEFGWSSHPNTGDERNWEWGVTHEEQADYAVRAIKLVRERYPYVTKMFWYTERDRIHQDPQHNNLGLLYYDLDKKPVYFAIKEYLDNRSR